MNERKATVTVSVKVDVQTVDRVDAWRRKQTILPSTSAAIRRLLVIALDQEGIKK